MLEVATAIGFRSWIRMLRLKALEEWCELLFQFLVLVQWFLLCGQSCGRVGLMSDDAGRDNGGLV